MMIAGHQADDTMFSYIARNLDADTCKLLLKAEPQLTFDKSFAILQIDCRRKSRNKIPQLLENNNFLFPKAISAEQCTHEEVARFHASLFNCDDRVLDMTMGLGVDTYYIAKQVHAVTAVELDEEIAQVGAYNFAFLAPNVTVENANSVEYLENLDADKTFDAILIDPARRGEDGRRLYSFADCLPNVVELLPVIERHCSCLYIKASPMLDITQSMRDLGECLTDVWAISIKNECKELLFKLYFKVKAKDVNLHGMNHDGIKWQCFSTQMGINHQPLSSPNVYASHYLYEPNASIMKLGCYKDVEHAFGAPQLSTNSHLMLSDSILDDFPGRRFRIIEVVPFKSKEIKQLSRRYKQMNIAVRNFRLTADALKKRLGIKDGGNIYLFASTTDLGEQVMLVCEKF